MLQFSFKTHDTYQPTQYEVGIREWEFTQDPLLLIERPLKPIGNPEPFFFGCADPFLSTYRFREGRDFNLYRLDYTPNSSFPIPEPCYGGFTPVTTPTISGDLSITLNDLTGVAVAFSIPAVNRNMIRDSKHIPSENSNLFTIKHCHESQKGNLTFSGSEVISENTSRMDHILCAPQENAVLIISDFCSFVNASTAMSRLLHLYQEQATPIKVVLHGKDDNSEMIDIRLCSLREQGTPVQPNALCSVQEDTRYDGISEDKKVVYEITGEPYVPLHDFVITGYGAEVVTKTTIAPIVNYQLTFKPKHKTNEQFELDEYQADTLFSPVLFYPANTTYESEKIPFRRWQWLFNDPITVTQVHYRTSLIRQQKCLAEGGSLIPTVNKTCSIQEEGECPPPGLTPFVDPKPDIPVDPPSGGETITVPTKEVYKVQNVITTTLADGTTNIDIANVSLNFDSDSHSWNWSGDLLEESQVDSLRPAANGTGVIIHVTINGKTWHLLVEKTTTNRTFNRNVIGLSGRGISALLGAPYLPQNSVEINSVMSNQQIAESFLPSGWTLQWGLATWNIPANAYSHQNLTPLQALHKVVQECGGMLVPQTNAQVIKVVKRYPVLPWQFNVVSPDLVVPDDIIVQLTEEPVSTYGANAVHVHGFENGGSQAFCRITGSAGDRLAPTVSSNVITDSVAARAAGERALAGAYPQPKTKSIQTIMDGGTTIDLVEPGVFVEFVIGAVQDRGIVNTVSIVTSSDDQGVVTVGQSIGIGESTENSFSLFSELLPSDPLTLVTIISSSSGTSLVESVDGVQTRVRGVGITNAKYYVKGGKLDGQAPQLTLLPDVIV